MTKLTIKDIAQRCGVGKSTVSRVLNNAPNVSEKTREKIQAVINQLGFQPDRTARAMRGNQESVVGIIVTRLHSTAEMQTLSAILKQLYARNITPMIVESQFQASAVSKYFQLFEQRQVNGVIVFGFSSLPLETVQQWKSPIVSLVRAYPDISAVYYDDENAIKALLKALYMKGHRQIGYLGVDDQDETSGRIRNQSYLNFCKDYELTPNMVLAALDPESAFEQTAQLLKAAPSAVLCGSTSLAIGALKYLQKNQQTIPLAYLGENALLQHFCPDLLCLDFGYVQAGKTAVDLLLRQLNGDHCVMQQKVPFQLVE